MAKNATAAKPAPRAGLSALLNDVDDSAPGDPPVDREKIEAVSESAGFTARPAKPAKPRKTEKKTRSRKPTDAEQTPASPADDEVQRRIASRRPGRRSEGPKVQWNVRISEEHFAKIDVLREQTGVPFGKLAERAIDLLSDELSEPS